MRSAARVEAGGDARPDRAEAVEALGAGELHVLLLQVADGHVVQTGEAGDMLQRRFARAPGGAAGR
jgi:hypothetical protein